MGFSFANPTKENQNRILRYLENRITLCIFFLILFEFFKYFIKIITQVNYIETISFSKFTNKLITY